MNLMQKKEMSLVLPFSKPAITHLGQSWTGMRFNIPSNPKHSCCCSVGGRSLSLWIWVLKERELLLPGRNFPHICSPEQPGASQSLGRASLNHSPMLSRAWGIWGMGFPVSER